VARCKERGRWGCQLRSRWVSEAAVRAEGECCFLHMLTGRPAGPGLAVVVEAGSAGAACQSSHNASTCYKHVDSILISLGAEEKIPGGKQGQN